MEKKYEILEDSAKKVESTIDDVTVYRIKALKDFNDVKKGDLGGFIQNEMNLSQDGNCWVYNDRLSCRSSDRKQSWNNTSRLLVAFQLI